MNKRSFLQSLFGFAVLPPFLQHLQTLTSQIEHLSPEEVAQDEAFWARIRGDYRLKPDYINLENGYYCFVPQETLENYIQHIRHVNYQGSYYMRTVQWANKSNMAAQLANILGAGKDEVIITRNTTESLDTVINGMHWEKGDEAVFADQDYGAMQNMFKLMARRYGIVNNIVSVPNHPKSDEEIVDIYAKAITPKTKLLMVCHMINITGHVLPIRKIVDMAHEKGVDVMVDGAHAFAHLTFDIKDLDCDYYGTSLHKWLSVPLGAGMLYVKKGKVKNLWPMFAEGPVDEDDIRKLNHTGTHPVHTDLAVGNAIAYYQMLGPERKEARLRYLQQYWTSKVRELPKINVNTPADSNRACGIANVGIDGIPPGELSKRLMKEHRIWTVAINRPPVVGIRVTPNIYTTTRELDAFAEALKTLSTT